MIIKHITEVEEGMVLAKEIYDSEGNELLANGMKLSERGIKKLELMGIDYVYILSNVIEINDIKNGKINKYYESNEETRKNVKEAFNEVLDNKNFDLEQYKEIITEIFSEVLTKDGIILNLENLKQLDDYYFEHAINTTVLAVATALMLGLNRKLILNIAIGSILHDIGNVSISKAILDKTEELTDFEVGIIENHTIFGYDYLKNNDDISSETLDAIKYHHENVDGSGYPEGLEMTQIPLSAKICGICDLYDSLLCKRDEISRYEATQYILDNVDKKFDKYITKKFIKVIGHYPKGTHLILSNGYHGLVIKENHFKPTLKLLLDGYGNKVVEDEILDLSKSDILIYDIDAHKKAYKNLLEYYIKTK